MRRTALRRLATAVAVLLLLAAVACELLVRRSEGLTYARGHILVEILGWLAAGTLATLLLVRAPARRALLLVAGVFVATQAIALASGPQMSDDLYRYTWDARVASSGIDPYLYPPDAPQLDTVRTPYLWPDAAQCAIPRNERGRTARTDPFAGSKPPGCTRINRPDVRTIYPPVAQYSFRLAAFLTPDSIGELQVQAPAAFAALLLLALIVLLLRRAGQSPAWALLYAATPLSGLESTMDGHVDVVAAVCSLGVVLVLASRRIEARPRLRQALTGIGVAAAILVKLYPAVFAPAAAGAFAGVRRRVVVAAWVVVTAAALYADHLLATNGRVLGYLPGYLNENGYNSGMRYVLLDRLGLRASQTTDLVAVLAAAAGVAPGLRVSEAAGWQVVARRMLVALGLVMLVANPGDAWYCVPLVALAAVCRRPEWMGVVVAAYTSYVDSLLRWHSNWPLAAWSGAAALVVAAAVARRAIGDPA